MDSVNRNTFKEFEELEIRILSNNIKGYDIGQFSSENPCGQDLIKILHYVRHCMINYSYFEILQLNLNESDLFSSDLRTCDDNFELLLKDISSDKLELQYVKHLLILFVGVAALQEFIRLNFLGPNDKTAENYENSVNIFAVTDISDEEIVRRLSRDGEFIYPNVVQPRLLYFSHLFLSNIRGTVCLSHKWWLLRCLFTYQQVLPDRCVSLHNEIFNLVSEIKVSEWINIQLNVSSKLFFSIEMAQICLYYHDVVEARKYLTTAQDITGIEFTLSGAMGKKTQFQQKAVAQLFVNIERNRSKLTDALCLDEDIYFPLDLTLQDDTLLDKVAFIDKDDNLICNLSLEEQIVLLGHCCFIRKSEAADTLLQEELVSYIYCLLSQPKVWSLYVKALIMRCKIDKSSSRKLDRALRQMEDLVHCIKRDQPPFSVRQKMFFCSSLPASWLLEKDLADFLLSIGAIKSALEIYERFQLWEDIVTCYQMLGRTNHAEEIIRKQLQNGETPMLWCLLGDVTEDSDNYIKAWELSGHKSARAQRSLGYYYFKRRDYPNCLPCFLKSLEINHLQPSVWFSVGHAATQISDYEVAARAYRQVVTLDQDSFEAWNNLSNAYIKTKQKMRAWRSLKEALRCNYEEWKVWENFLVVSIDVGAFEDVLWAWHRLLDLKGKYKDPEVLEILVKAINEDLPDMNGVTSSRLKTKALQLLGRLTSIVTNDSKVWELYSLLCCPQVDSVYDKEILEKAIRYQKKALHCFQNAEWEKDFKLCKEILNITLRFAEMSVVYIKLLEGELRNQTRVSAKLALKNIISQTEKNLENFQVYEKNDVESVLCSLNEFLNEILTL